MTSVKYLDSETVKKKMKTKLKEKDLGYTIHKHISLSGISVAKRSRYQLISSIIYLIDFNLRKVNRRTDLFKKIINNDKSEF